MSYREDPRWLVSLIEKCGPYCWYCGVQIARSVDMREQENGAWIARDDLVSPTRDHQTPRSRGGSNKLNNLVLACHKCNCTKGTLTLEEYREKLAQKENAPITFCGEVAQ